MTRDQQPRNSPTNAAAGHGSLDRVDMRVPRLQEALERIIACPNVTEDQMARWTAEELMSHAAEASVEMQRIAQEALAHIIPDNTQ
jgi:hypothetical protein